MDLRWGDYIGLFKWTRSNQETLNMEFSLMWLEKDM